MLSNQFAPIVPPLDSLCRVHLSRPDPCTNLRRPSKKKEKKRKNLLPFDHWPYINHETTVLKFFLCTSFRYLSTLNRNRNRRTRMRMYKISTFKNFTKLNFKIQNRNIKHIIEFLKINFHDLYIYIYVYVWTQLQRETSKVKKFFEYHFYYQHRDHKQVPLLLPTIRRILHSCRSIFCSASGKIFRGEEEIFGARVFRSGKAEKSVTRRKINLGIDSRRLWKARGYSRDCRILRALPPSLPPLVSILFLRPLFTAVDDVVVVVVLSL